MPLDLPEYRDIATSMGWSAAITSETQLDIELPDGLVLRLINSKDGDEVVGFAGTPWHFHPPVLLEVTGSRSQELSMNEILESIAAGDLMVIESWERGSLADRWLQHRDVCIGLTHVQIGEEIRTRIAGAGEDVAGELFGRA